MIPLLERLTAAVMARADVTPDIAVLQPANPFLDTVGEAMRRELFVTAGSDDAPLCLRPEFTIPLCLHHIAEAATACSYAGCGTVFRQRDDKPEFAQTGIEYLGHADAAAADVTALVDLVAVLDAREVRITLGDKALFAALLDGLDLTASWRGRLLHAFGDEDALATLQSTLASEPAGEPATEDEAAAVAGDAETLETRVRDLMLDGGISPTAGRAPAIVAQRMIERARDARVRLDPFAAHVLRSFLTLEAPLSEATGAIATLAQQGGIDLADEIADLRERAAGLREALGHRADLRFRAGFGRPLDYYTGLLIEARIADRVVAVGGRYDRLCTVLGSPEAVPAVGFTIDVDALEAAT
ncbi:ATP phosphoribosyltransferase regulatory subunit [Rhizobiaceae bacterium]|nr:ATP phosphoribosyltransferase regulatory subunit [Rhizobiaceae bacterium]